MSGGHTILAGRASAAPDALPRDWPGARHSRFVGTGAMRWHVQSQGSGATTLFVHGAGASLHSFAPLIAALGSRRRCIAFDLPGHGFSSPFRGGAYTLRRTAQAVDDLLGALDASPTLIVGHSAGAAIALQWLLDRAAAGVRRLPRVVALNPALRPFGGVAGFAFPAMARLAAASGSLSGFIARRAADRGQVERLIAGTGSRVPAEMLDCYQYLLRRRDHVQAVLSMMAGWQLHGLVRAVRDLDPAMHVVLGGRDRAVPAGRTASTLAPLVNTRITELPDYGHLVHEEAPALVADLLLRGVAVMGESDDA